MKHQYVRTFGTERDGNSAYEWTENRESAAVYDEVHANIDCDLLNRYSPHKVTPEGGRERLVFDNFRLDEISEGRFAISFEARPESEWFYFHATKPYRRPVD